MEKRIQNPFVASLFSVITTPFADLDFGSDCFTHDLFPRGLTFESFPSNQVDAFRIVT